MKNTFSFTETFESNNFKSNFRNKRGKITDAKFAEKTNIQLLMQLQLMLNSMQVTNNPACWSQRNPYRLCSINNRITKFAHFKFYILFQQ